MRKYGKYEKRPAGAFAEQPKAKSMLLQTYFSGLLCLLLCVTMFFGTSYAWFTSEVKNADNEIFVGTLKVGLYKGDVNLEGSDTKLFDGNIRWEPGYTLLETVTVKNEGELAFKYVLNFTDGSLAAGSTMTLEDVAKHFEVRVYNGTASAASYEELTEANGWTGAVSLAELLTGKTVLSGALSARDEANTYTVALHMKEDADAQVMGQRIGLNVKLVAYQMAFEKDSFGNENYDDGVTVASDAAGLQSALSSAGSIQLINDIQIASEAERVTMSGGVLDGNAKTLTYSGGRNANNGSVGVLTTSGGVVKNLTVVGGENGRAVYITKLTSDLTVSDCVLSGVYAFNLNSADKTDYTLSFKNTVFRTWTSYANAAKCVDFTDCTFEAVLKPYGDTFLTNCSFTTEGLNLSALAEGEAITLTQCTYNGVHIENAVLTAGSEGIAVEGSNAIEVVGGTVVLKTNQ